MKGAPKAGKPGVKLSPAVARGKGVEGRRETSAQSLNGVGARVPASLSTSLPPNIGKQPKGKKGK